MAIDHDPVNIKNILKFYTFTKHFKPCLNPIFGVAKWFPHSPLLLYYLYYLIPGLVFMKGLRLSQVLGLNPVLKLRLLSQLSFVLKPYSQRVT